MPLLLAVLLDCIVIYLAFINLKFASFKVIEAFPVILAMLAVGMLSFRLTSVFGFSAIIANSAIVAILTIVTSIKTKTILINMIYAILAVMTALLAANVSGVILLLAGVALPMLGLIYRDTVMSNLALSLIYTTIVFTISFGVSKKLGRYFYKQIAFFNEALKRRLAIYILFGALITLALFFINTFLHDILAEAAMLATVYAISLAITFVYFIFSVFAFTDNMRKSEDLRNKEEQLFNLDMYTKQVEHAAGEVRAFRHDHRNMLLIFREYINSGDIKGLKTSYGQYMGAFSAETDIMDECMDRLGNIHTIELKSLISAKCIEVLNRGIRLNVEVEGDVIVTDDYNLLDFCRLNGILMDNAIEACKGIPEAEICFFAKRHENTATFIYENTCHTTPELSKLFKKGYSTKESGSGLGLYNASKMLVRNKNISIDTTYENNMFSQMITIIDPL